MPHAKAAWKLTEVPMSTLHKTIVENFLVKLGEGKDVDAGKIEQLRKLLADNKKPRAEDFVKIFIVSEDGDVK
jgi:hypothetical protein